MRRQNPLTAGQDPEVETLIMPGNASEDSSQLPEYPAHSHVDPRSSSTFSFSRPPANASHESLHVTTNTPTSNNEGNYNNAGSSPVYTDIFPARRAPDSENPPVSRVRSNAAALRRQNTLSKPERHRSTRRALMRSPSAGPPPARVGATSATAVRAHETGNHKPAVELEDSGASAIWTWTARIMTCCFLPPCLRACGQRDKAVQQAWREKVALCMIIVVLCGAVAFLTVGLRRVLCPDSGFQVNIAMFNIQTKEYLPANQDGIVIDGFQYEFGGVQKALSARGFTLNDDRRGTDLSLLFSNVRGSDCAAYYPAGAKCDFPELAGISPASDCASLDWLSGVQRAKRFMDWTDLPIHIDPPHTLTVYNGAVLNLTDYFAGPQRDNRPAVTKLLVESVGKDATYRYVRGPEVHSAIGCLSRGYRVGYVGEERNGCIAAQVIETIALIVIVGVVLCKFFMAVWFHWFGLPSSKVDPVPRPDKRLSRVSARYSMGPNVNNRHSVLGFNMPQTNDLYTIMLVTCYSEGKEGIRSTLDSLAGTDYPDSKKLLFVVADGIITGSGEERSTPDIIVGMMDLEPSAANPEPKSYVAIAHGEKQHNMAKVYAGHYIVGNRRVPMITVVKCGTPMEANQPKPGNRGKRDSQLVIMNFLSRTLFNDRMTALDYEIFSCIHSVATTADKYEAILMVDADTKVAPDSLRHMVNAMRSDVTIMGLCGETRIANKTASLTSAIQVFEYYISHHLGKAFESVFGGVTCLPGCFCMYRIKAPKGDSGTTVPILTNPNIVEEYSENIVDTLHKKNLLLLGEDRFLTTLMLRNFPHRKMVFVPSAMCWTIVPDEFKVLLSQRRRWINSTVHNLLELVLVRDLCGTFCFSMQFVVLLELIGTVVLPAAICLTLYLIISAAAYGTAELVPFLMLAAILGLPGLLIAITTRKVVYVAWMIVYLFSLPIWNFVLPVYAYWHFDDFSWGETRKVEGEEREEAHGGKQGRFESRAVVMKKWAEWEKEKQGGPSMKSGEAHRQSVYNKHQSTRIKSMYGVPYGPPMGPAIPSDYNPRKSIGAAPHGAVFPPPPSHPQSNEYWPVQQTTARDSYFPPLLMGGLPRAPMQFPSSAAMSTQSPVDPATFPSPGGIFQQGPPRAAAHGNTRPAAYEMQPRGGSSSASASVESGLDSAHALHSSGSGDSRPSSSKGKERQ